MDLFCFCFQFISAFEDPFIRASLMFLVRIHSNPYCAYVQFYGVVFLLMCSSFDFLVIQCSVQTILIHYQFVFVGTRQ